MANKEKKMTRTETRSHSWKELEIPGVRGRLEADGFRFVSRSSDTKTDHYQREVAVDPVPDLPHLADALSDLPGHSDRGPAAPVETDDINTTEKDEKPAKGKGKKDV